MCHSIELRIVMCSINGLYKSQQQPVNLAELNAMATPMQHRGPNGQHHLIHNSIGLYHQRLAIHDLSDAGRQPFQTPAHTAAIVNGEIYNYIELKDELLRGDRDLYWQSQSDCEVVPYLYEKYGLDFVAKLRGMYALAIYDPKTEQLILARDPFGMKQLYFYQDASGFYFASEARAIAQHLTITQTDKTTLVQTSQLHFACGAETVYHGIYRVRPGETLIIKAGELHARGFYPTKLGFPANRSRRLTTEASALKQFDAIFAETMKLHLQADVPVGLFLSGGIDSSCLLTMIARLHSQPLHTYTIGFESTETHDERHVAAELARQFKTQHHEIAFSETDFWQLLPQAIQATDDPTADYAIVPTFKLAQAAAADVTVVLSGEGGDEVFAGYGRYRSFIRPFWKMRRDLYAKGDLSRLKLLKDNSIDWRHQLITLKKACVKEQYDRLYTAQTIDMQTWLANDLLIKLDRCLMWHSLEGRTPFLDKAMLEFANSLPNHYKIRGKLGKWILRQWLANELPHYNAFAHKQGFSVPIREWLNNRREWLRDFLLTHTLVQDLVNTTRLNKILQQPLTSSSAKACWSLLYLAMWHSIHIDNHPHSTLITSYENGVMDAQLSAV